MSRRVILMRHAKSGWDDASLSDRQRPLNLRGRKDAPRMASALAELQWIPDRIVVSDSRRTLETLECMRDVLGVVAVETRSELYHPTVPVIQEVIESSRNDETLMILTHNPATELIVHEMTGEYHPMPTAACALFIEQNNAWVCQKVLRPKELRE